MNKKTKKIVAAFLAGVLLVCCAAGLTGCGKQGGESSTGSTVLNIKVLRLGFGEAHIEALIKGFEELYAEEGYKVNIVSADSTNFGTTVLNELLLGDSNNVDMYFTENITPYMLAQNAKEAGMDMLAADLTDVYNSKPIGSKGEEDVLIKDKMNEQYLTYFTYDGEDENYNGKQYLFPVHKMAAGLVVNERLLSSYNLEVPRTTDELIQCYKVIGAKSGTTGVYPNVWAGYNAMTYWRFLEDVWVAQYSGVDYYNKFMSMEYSDDINEGWKVYEDQSWVESLKVAEALLNLDYAPAKSLSMDHTTAQHKFLSGEAVFMSNGAWLQNEMSSEYSAEDFNITMIQTPVVSALGVKLGLDGKGGTDAAKCDAVLSQIIKLVDGGKSNDEIVSEVAAANNVTITAEQAEAVRAARSVYFDKSGQEGIIVNAYSDKLDVAKLFLRYLASDEGSRLILENSMTYSAFESSEELSLEGQSSFMKSVNEIAAKEGATLIYRQSNGLRTQLGISFFNTSDGIERKMASSQGTVHAEDIMKQEIKYIQGVWPERIKALGN